MYSTGADDLNAPTTSPTVGAAPRGRLVAMGIADRSGGPRGRLVGMGTHEGCPYGSGSRQGTHEGCPYGCGAIWQHDNAVNVVWHNDESNRNSISQIPRGQIIPQRYRQLTGGIQTHRSVRHLAEQTAGPPYRL